jgi:hypothetical protein
MAPAQKHFPAVLEMEAPEDLRGLARNGLREMAALEFKAMGPRIDAIFYLLDTLQLFHGNSVQRDPGDHLRDRHNGQIRAGHQRPPGELFPASAAEEDLLGASARLHHVCGIQED